MIFDRIKLKIHVIIMKVKFKILSLLTQLSYLIQPSLAMKFNLVFYLLLVSCNCLAQNVDSLKEMLNIKTGQEKAILLGQISDLCKKEEIFNYAKECYDYSKKINFGEGMSLGLHNLGVYYQYRSNQDSAIYYLNRSLALKIANKESKENINLTRVAIVQTYIDNGNLALADKTSDENLKAIGESIQISFCETQNQKGYISGQLGDFKASISHYYSSYYCYKQNGNEKEACGSLNNLSNAYLESNDVLNAIKFYTKSLELNNNRFFDHKLNSLNGIGVAYIKLEDFETALRIIDSCIQLNTKLKSEADLASNYFNKGEIYTYLKEFDLAIESFNKCTALDLKNKNLSDIGLTENNIGQAYRAKGDFVNARKYYQLAESSTLKFPNKKLSAMVKSNLALYYYKQHKMDSAYYSMKLALNLFQEMENKLGIANAYNHLALWNLEENKLLEAEKYGVMGLMLSKQIRRPKYVLDVSQTLATVYSKQKNFKLAYEMQSLHSKISDSLKNDSLRLVVVRKQLNEELQMKDLENSKTLKGLRVALSKNKSIAILLTGLISVSSFVFFIIFRNKRRKQQVHYSLQLKEQELATLRAQMNPHYMANMLQSIHAHLSENLSNIDISYINKLSKLNRLILEFGKQESIPIQKEIEILTLFIELENLTLLHPCKYEFVIDEKLDTLDCKMPTMILQPIIENCIKHGIKNKKSQGHIKIDFLKKNDMLQCTITDDGVPGMKLKEYEATQHRSMSLEIIRNRLKLINELYNKEASIISNPILNELNEINGNCVTINIPIL